MNRLLLVLFCLFIMRLDTNASHIMGAEITYKAISSKKYEVTLKVYRDCRGIPLGNPTTFAVACASGGPLRSFIYSKVSIRDVSPKCDTVTVNPCTPANTTVSAQGFEEHVYVGTIDFNSGGLATDIANGCCQFRIFMDECCRNGATNTGAAGNIYVESLIDV